MFASWLSVLQNPVTLVEYVILPIVLLLGGIYWYMRTRAKDAKQTTSTAKDPTTNPHPKTETKPVTVRLWDSQYGKMFNTQEIDGAVVDQVVTDWGSLGRLWDEDGEKLFEINRYQKDDKTWSYRPIEARITDTRANSPQRVEGAFHHSAVPIWCNVTPRSKGFGKLAPILWFCGFAIFVMMVILLKK